MSKTIIFCADGTWNGPGEDDKEVLDAHFTNVFKLFVGLAGTASPDSIRLADEQEKVLQANGRPIQVSKYIHGVGDSRNPIRKVVGGTFGAGTISRVVRGYTFISLEQALKDDAYRLPEDYIGNGGFSWIHRWSRAKGMPNKGEPDEPAWVAAEYKKTQERRGVQ